MDRASQPRTGESAWQVLSLSGEIDIATAPVLRDRLARAAATPFGDVVVDLSEVTFMDCSALGVLMQARVGLRDRLWLRGLPRPVVRLLRLTGLQATFALLPAVATAAADPPVARPMPAVGHTDTRAGGSAAARSVPEPASAGGQVGDVVTVTRGAFEGPVRPALLTARL